MRLDGIVPALVIGIVAAPVSANMDGVSYTTKNCELVKRVGAHRSVIYPDLQESRADVERREDEAKTGLGSLGAGLNEFLARLRTSKNPYPLLRNIVLDYVYLRPPEQSPEKGRMYIMYTGELHWRFPAPLLADMVRIRVAHSFPQPLKDLLTTALMRWGRDHIEGPRQSSPSVRREQTAGWIDDLTAADVVRVSWRHDRVIKNLELAALDPDHVVALEGIARAGDVRTRVAALKVLGTGGHVRDPEFFAELLRDPVPEVRHAAFWGLVFMEGSAGLPHIQKYSGRAQAIGARLKDVRAGVTAELVAEQVQAFDAVVATLTGQDPVEATPYVVQLTPAELLSQVKAAKEKTEAAESDGEEEKVPAPAAEEPETPERKPVVPEPEPAPFPK